MSKTRIGTFVRCGPVNMIHKLNRSKQGPFLLLRAGVTIRSAMLVLLAALLAAIPSPVLAATPDPVLEWIGVMNTTVLTAGTAPNVTGRVVALVSVSVSMP